MPDITPLRPLTDEIAKGDVVGQLEAIGEGLEPAALHVRFHLAQQRPRQTEPGTSCGEPEVRLWKEGDQIG